MGKDSGHGSIQHVYEGYGFDSGVEPLLQQPVVPTNTIDVDAEGVPVKKGGMTLNGGVANLTNTILGVGTMAMPLALKLCGITLYTVLMLGVCLAAMKAVGVLFESVEMLNVKNARYPSLGRATYGFVGEQVASWAVTLQQFGACIAYTVVIADLLQPVLKQSGLGFFEERWPMQIVIMSCIVFPLCLLPTLDSLKFVSTTSITLILAVVAITVANGIYVISSGDADEMRHKLEDELYKEKNGHYPSANETHRSDKISIYPTGMDFLSALPIISFSFLCHQNAFPIYKELAVPSAGNMQTIAVRSMTLCCCTYFLSAFFGYLTFLDQTDGNLILDFPVKDSYIAIPMDIARAGFGCSFILSFPLMVWEARHNLDTLIFGERPYDFKRNFCMTLFVVGVSAIIGIKSPSIEIVLELVGSTCSPTMVYILPGMFFLKAQKEGPLLSRRNLPAILLVTLGCVLIPLCLYVWVKTYIVDKK